MRTKLRSVQWVILLSSVLCLGGQPNRVLTIHGHSGNAEVVQVNGRDYVEVEGIARLTNASITFHGNEIVLTVAGAHPNAGPAPAGFSKQFVTAGIETAAELREWRAALQYAIEGGYPLSEPWLSGFRAKSQKALQIASVSASSGADTEAVPLLRNQFENMNKLSDKYLHMAKSMSYIDRRSLDKDPLDQKINACSHALSAMVSANRFSDDVSCH